MLSDNAVKALNIATGSKQNGVGDEIAAAIDASGSGPADAVSAIGATSNLSVLVPVAAGLVAGTPAAASLSNSAGTYAIPSAPTGAEVDTAINQSQAKVITALGLKTEQLDFVQAISDMNAALLLKADNNDADLLRSQVEARMDVVEAKIDLIIANLKAAGLMAS